MGASVRCPVRARFLKSEECVCEAVHSISYSEQCKGRMRCCVTIPNTETRSSIRRSEMGDRETEKPDAIDEQAAEGLAVPSSV